MALARVILCVVLALACVACAEARDLKQSLTLTAGAPSVTVAAPSVTVAAPKTVTAPRPVAIRVAGTARFYPVAKYKLLCSNKAAAILTRDLKLNRDVYTPVIRFNSTHFAPVSGVLNIKQLPTSLWACPAPAVITAPVPATPIVQRPTTVVVQRPTTVVTRGYGTGYGGAYATGYNRAAVYNQGYGPSYGVNYGPGAALNVDGDLDENPLLEDVNAGGDYGADVDNTIAEGDLGFKRRHMRH